MATSLERMEDEAKGMVENLVKEALCRLDHQIVLIDDRAKLLERIEKIEANVEALISEAKFLNKRIEGLEQFAEQQALKNAEIVAQRDTLDEQAEMLLYLEGRIDTIRNHIAEPPAEVAAMALYGGEQ